MPYHRGQKMSKYFYKDKPITGLDIGQTSIKIMSLNPSKMTVLGYGSLDIDPSKMQQSLEEDGAYLVERLKVLLEQKVVGHLDSSHVVLGIPASKTYNRSITLPADIKGDLMSAIKLEAEQSIPIPIDQLYIDYEVTARSNESINVYTCAVPKKIVDSCVAAAESVGLEVVLVEPSMHAVARLLRVNEHGDLPTVVVDIGAANTDVAILNQTIKVIGSAQVGGNTLTLDISEALKITLEQAHQLKVLSGMSAGTKQRKITKAVTPSLQKINGEIKKMIRYYTERIPEAQKVEQVLIIGGGSNMPGIGDFFTDNLELASRVASPWQHLSFGKLPQPSKQFKAHYISVVGLAMVHPKDIWR